MPYPDFIDRLLRSPDLLTKLVCTEPLSWQWPDLIQKATPQCLLGNKPVADVAALALVRGALHYAVDDLDRAHRIFQDDPTPTGSYWHGMLHRREGDFDNARYWFRRAGRLGVFRALHEAASAHSPLMARQMSWDAYVLTGQCEQARHGAEESLGECIALQRVEFDGMFRLAWERAAGVTESQ